MHKLYILVGVLLVVGAALAFLKPRSENASDVKDEKPKYQYKRKQFFLTRAEHECHDALLAAVGNRYHVFVQAHLPSILDHKVQGQNWKAALAHIDRKSVDFVLCDKAYISPKLAIELDDRSHERSDRQERDREVERVLRDAGLPLLRIENRGAFSAEDLGRKINDALSGSGR